MWRGGTSTHEPVSLNVDGTLFLDIKSQHKQQKLFSRHPLGGFKRVSISVRLIWPITCDKKYGTFSSCQKFYKRSNSFVLVINRIPVSDASLFIFTNTYETYARSKGIVKCKLSEVGFFMTLSIPLKPFFQENNGPSSDVLPSNRKDFQFSSDQYEEPLKANSL